MSKEETKALKKLSPVGKIFDFPERWSPMLVKELRQGLRSISFAGLFITLQAILCFIIFIILSDFSGSGVGSTSAVSGVIFGIYAVAVCALQPLRGFNAISAEINGDTIDLVLITRLSAWKFVFGKWVSLMSQSLMFAISLLPYLILRYFLGGMLLFEELLLFVLIFISGSVATAIAVGASAIRAAVLRYLTSTVLVGTLIVFTFMSISQVFEDNNNIYYFLSRNGGLEGFLYFTLICLVTGANVCWMFLDFGASMIAPLSENRATLRRLIYLAVLTIGGISLALLPSNVSPMGYTMPNPASPMIQIVLFIMLVPFFITTFCEHAYLSPRIAMQMKNSSFLGKFKAILYPGWGSGSLFLIIACVIHMIYTFSFRDHRSSSIIDFNEEFALTISICLGTLTFPALIVSLFARNSVNRLSIYLISLIGSFLILLVCLFVGSIVDEDIAIIFIWCPPANFYIWAQESVIDWHDNEEALMLLNLILTGAYWAIILMRSAPVWSHIRQQEKVAKEEKSRLEIIENDGIPTTETTPAE